MKLFVIFLAATLSLGVAEAKKMTKKSSRQPASVAAEVLPASTPYDVNPEGDRSMTCSVEQLNMRWEGSVRISDFHVQTDSDSFKITYQTSRDGQAKVAHGICAGANGTYSCQLDGQADSSGVTFSGSIAKVGNDVTSNIQMQFSGDADTGPRAAETYPVHCSVPCVIDNFIRTGHLNGNGTQNSCASSPCTNVYNSLASALGQSSSASVHVTDLSCSSSSNDSGSVGDATCTFKSNGADKSVSGDAANTLVANLKQCHPDDQNVSFSGVSSSSYDAHDISCTQSTQPTCTINN